MDELQLPLLLAGLATLGVLFWLRQRQAAPAATAHPGRRITENLDTLQAWPPERTRLLSQTERRALRLLRQALPAHHVFVQIPLARFLKVPTRHSYAEWLRRVGQLCADFVICDDDAQVLAIVELRPPPHRSSEKARRRQERLDRVVQAAGISLYVWNEEALPSPMAVREVLAGLAGLAAGAEDGPLPVAQPDTGFAQTAPGLQEHADRDPPPSTWFDDLDSGQVPLGPTVTTPAALERIPVR
jgi:hypothetical protein